MVGRGVGLEDGVQTAPWQAMLAAARSGAFDVLVVGYASRFLRNLKQTLIAVEDQLSPGGVAVLRAGGRATRP